MRLFAALYDRALVWAAHRHAPRYLATLSFAESSFFPIPPDVMLAPMALAQPDRAWRFAALTTIASVAGGLAGYLIGMFAFDLIQPWLASAGYLGHFEQVQKWFDEWGFWIIFIAGFSIVPYKVFTISAGLISMSVVPFLIASVISRGARFYLVAGLMVWGGAAMRERMRAYVDIAGWALIVAAVVAYFLLRD